jgi:hypothetical protein
MEDDPERIAPALADGADAVPEAAEIEAQSHRFDAWQYLSQRKSSLTVTVTDTPTSLLYVSSVSAKFACICRS